MGPREDACSIRHSTCLPCRLSARPASRAVGECFIFIYDGFALQK